MKTVSYIQLLFEAEKDYINPNQSTNTTDVLLL
jgi:hypothetical protein